METTFYILLNLKTPQGFVNYGQFFLGNEREAAHRLFSQLTGNPELSDECLLHIDLMETTNGLPEKIKTICCTLDALGVNCKLITKEIFRLKNLEDIK